LRALLASLSVGGADLDEQSAGIWRENRRSSAVLEQLPVVVTSPT
jgi:hypothetical protein